MVHGVSRSWCFSDCKGEIESGEWYLTSKHDPTHSQIVADLVQVPSVPGTAQNLSTLSCLALAFTVTRLRPASSIHVRMGS